MKTVVPESLRVKADNSLNDIRDVILSRRVCNNGKLKRAVLAFEVRGHTYFSYSIVLDRF